MDTTKFTMGIVGLVVIILMVTGAVLPAVENAQETQVTEAQNTGYKFTASSGADLNLSITYDSEQGVLSVGGYELTSDDLVLGDMILICKDLYIRATATGSMQIFDIANTVHSAAITSFTVVDGVYSYTASSTEYTGTLTNPCYYLTTTGDYGMFKPGSLPVNVNADKPILVVSAEALGSPYNAISAIAAGTIKDGLSVLTGARWSSGAYTPDVVSNPILTYEEKNGYYSVSGFKATYLSSDGATTSERSPINDLFAPIEYTYVTSEQSSMVSLLGIIPLLLIIVAVLYAVRLMGASRN